MTTTTAPVLPDPDVEPTLALETAARLLGYGRQAAYAAATTGDIAGVPVIRVGRNYRVPTRPLLRLLGVDDD